MADSEDYGDAPEPAPVDPASTDGRFGIMLGLGIAAGIALGIVGAMLWANRGDDPEPASTSADRIIESTSIPGGIGTVPPTSFDLDPATQLATAAEFLNAWRTSRSVEAVVTYTQTRERDGGSTVTSNGMLVQAPPQRLESHFGSVEGILDAAPATCEASAAGRRTCRRSTTGTGDFAGQINSQIDNLRLLFTTDPASYRVVATDPGCFDLTLLVEVGGAPFGRMATVCFDETTGVLATSEITFAGGLTETKTATSMRTSVSAADFEAILAL